MSKPHVVRCRHCNGRVMRARHRIKRALRAQGLASVAKRARAVVKRLAAAGQVPYRLVGTLKRFVWAEVVTALPKGPMTTPVRGLEMGPRPIDMVTMLKERAKNWRSRQTATRHNLAVDLSMCSRYRSVYEE